MSETEFNRRALLRFGADPRLRLWRQNTGVGLTMDAERVIRFGLNGSGDLSGILMGGTRIEIEDKTKTGRQSKDQKSFQAMIERFGGLYVLARDEDDIERAIAARLVER